MDGLTQGILGLQQAKIAGQIQLAVARKAMDVQKMQGAGVMKLLDAASRGAAQAGDALVAEATGLGGTLDTYA